MKKSEILNQFLDEVNARCIANTTVNSQSFIDIYTAKGKTFFVQTFTDRKGEVSGFDIYIPAYEGNELKGTFDNTKNYLNAMVYEAPMTTLGEAMKDENWGS